MRHNLTEEEKAFAESIPPAMRGILAGPPWLRDCHVCEEIFWAQRRDGVYCSGRCKLRAFRRRRGIAPRGENR